MNTKRKGSRIVYKIRDWLKASGYHWVITSAASLGPFDLIAFGKSDIRLIQAKANKWPPRKEVKKIEAVEVPDIGNLTNTVFIKEIWRWKDYARQPDIKRLISSGWVNVGAPLRSKDGKLEQSIKVF